MAFIDVWPKKVGVSAVLVINRVWFLSSSLELLMFFLTEATFEVIKRVGKIVDFCHTYSKGFGKRAAQPHPILLGVPFLCWRDDNQLVRC